MEIGKENEGETEKLASNSLVSSAVLRDDIVDLQDFIERLKNEEDQIVDQTEKLTFLLACLQLCYYMSDGPNVEMSCISFEVHDLIQSLFNQSSGDDMMVKLTDHVIPRLLENITSSKITDHHHSESSVTMTEDQLVELLDVLLVNLHNLPKVHAELIFPSMTQYELLQNAFGNLRDFYALKVNGCVEYETIEYVLPQFQLMAKIVGHFCFVLLSNQLDKTNEKYDMMNNVLGRLIKQLLEASPDLLIEYLIHLQERVINAITPSTSARNIHVMIEFLFIILYDVSKDIIHHGKLFVLLEVVEALIEELIFILPDTAEKIKLVKKEVQEKIPKSSSIIVANAPNKAVECKIPKSSGIIIGFEEETEWIIRKLTSGPAEIDVISIVGMPGLGKTILAYRVYNSKSIVDHFDVCAWCTVDQESNEKKLLQKIFNQVIGLKERFSEKDIDDDVADKLRKQLFGKRYLIILDDMWDTETFDELTRPFPELQKGSRVILTSRKKEVALHGKCHSDPLYLRLLRSEESWELLEKRVFREERCPDELKDVGEKIARKCDGLPLVLDLIGGVISRKEKTEALWLEVLDNLSSFIFKDEEEVVKVIQLSYDHLSDHVKPCLVYLASYPKDENLRISELKDLWISQGLVEQIEIKSAEEVVDELISSSLVIPFDNSICKIHDLVHDFCSIKSRKEKFFDFIGDSNAPSSSSNLIPRGITIRYNEHLFDLDENSVLFKPEKKNPYVKHLLSLKVYGAIRGITLTDSLLNEISMLVHLKLLIFKTKAKALPPSFSNLCNLEILVVNNVEGSFMILSPCFWSLAKLRDVRMNICALFDPYINEPTVLDEDSRLENLRTLYELYLLCSEDTEDIFKRFPNLQNLRVCIVQQPYCSEGKICFPRLDVLNELEELHLSASWDSFGEYTHAFPLSLKTLKLRGLALTYDTLSRIARLPNLQELILEYTIIEEGKEWNMEDVTFQNLKSLKLVNVEFSEWQVDAEKSFPVLEKLHISRCDQLMDIPDSFGDIASLELIKVWDSPQLRNSTFNIKEYVEEMTGEDKRDRDHINQ
ncbi:hypothetical protein KY290_025659 [Solanum tuberosum]|uniref:NB-ARC domain-containing protein n=1 Tax=Solanum tuberosum TaxID=4113 RepID=A0ABQ7UUB8_SOLTU|nr:hypothetical protein KY290_025659 [Solanum tuberosum]